MILWTKSRLRSWGWDCLQFYVGCSEQHRLVWDCSWQILHRSQLVGADCLAHAGLHDLGHLLLLQGMPWACLEEGLALPAATMCATLYLQDMPSKLMLFVVLKFNSPFIFGRPTCLTIPHWQDLVPREPFVGDSWKEALLGRHLCRLSDWA